MRGPSALEKVNDRLIGSMSSWELARDVSSNGIAFLVFYGFLHCWLNAFAEMLRFADRQFYSVCGSLPLDLVHLGSVSGLVDSHVMESILPHVEHRQYSLPASRHTRVVIPRLFTIGSTRTFIAIVTK